VTVVRVRVTVRGRVQGVWYRDTCDRVARSIGVNGWVRNLPDGSVQVVAEGEREFVDGLLEWCQEGPPQANVTEIDIVDEQPTGEREFRIRY